MFWHNKNGKGRYITLLLILGILLIAAAATAAAAGGAGTTARQLSSDDLFVPCKFPGFEQAVQHFSKVLTFNTVSNGQAEQHVLHPDQFAALDAYLRVEAYPQVWAQLTVEKLGEGAHSYLITWPGSNSSLKPALFISHFDVVPVSPDTEQDWLYPPFSGTVAEGYIWGRGALDLKVSAVGLLEATTALLADGYQPERTLLLAIGHDEEVGGAAGAGHIAAKLEAEGQQLEFIWDEGGVVYAAGLPPFTRRPVALVATAEKFYQSVTVTLHSAGGHSSMPPIDQSSIAARVGALLSALTASPPPARLVSPTRELLEGLVALAPTWLAALFSIIKLLPTALVDHLVARGFAAANAASASLVRDTAALTLLQSGVADNVMPQTASASINFRLLPGTPVSDPVHHVQRWLGPNAAHADVSLGPSAHAPSAVTDNKGPAFGLLKSAIQEVWRFSKAAGPGLEGVAVPVLPYLMPGGTDSKHYQNLTTAILRFGPVALTPAGLSSIHGTNERISVQDFGRLLCTYQAGLRLAGGGSAASQKVPVAGVAEA